MRSNLLLLLLALLLAVPTYFTLQSESTQYTRYDEFPRLFPGINPDNIGVVTLRKMKALPPGQSPAATEPEFEHVIFYRQADRWVLASGEMLGVPVRPGLVEKEILQHFSDMRRDQDTLVTDAADEEFLRSRQLTADTGTIVSLQREAKAPILAELIKGKSAKDQNIPAYFVCAAPNTKEVILYEPNDRFWRLSMDVNDWIDPTVQEFLLADLQSFSLRNAKGQVGFRKVAGSEGTWVMDEAMSLPGVGAVRQSEVNNLVNHLSSIQAVGFLQQKEALDAAELRLQTGQSRIELQATLASGERIDLRIGKQIPNRPEFYAVASHHDFVFAFPNWAAQTFAVDPQDLFD